jgi:hypothetical protein
VGGAADTDDIADNMQRNRAHAVGHFADEDVWEITDC